MEESIVEILMRRDGMSADEAKAELAEARSLVRQGYDPEEILEDMFGLEPDFIFELI